MHDVPITIKSEFSVNVVYQHILGEMGTLLSYTESFHENRLTRVLKMGPQFSTLY